MPYQVPPTWVNGSTPALNATNLNKLSGNDIDHESRIVTLEGASGGSVTGTAAVATISDLKATNTTSLSTNEARIVLGYWGAGDGGGGIFRLNKSSSTGDDDGTVIVATTGGGRWERVITGGFVDARWYGIQDCLTSTTLSSGASAGATSVSVAANTGLYIGSDICIAGGGTGGRRHFARVTNVSGTTITFTPALVTGPSSGARLSRDAGPRIVKALTYAQALGSKSMPVLFPGGEYECHEIDVNATQGGKALVEGQSPVQTHFKYNGDGYFGGAEAGYVFKFDSTSFGGLKNVSIRGANQQNTTTCKNCVVLSESPDIMSEWSGIALSNCTSDALLLESGVINFHVDKFRCDNYGGFAVFITGDSSMERRVITFTRITLDQEMDGAASAGYRGLIEGYGLYSSSDPAGTLLHRWGKGFVGFQDGRGLFLRASDGRFEYGPLKDNQNASLMVTEIATSSGTKCTVKMDNIVGFADSTQNAVIPNFRTVTNRLVAHADEISFMARSKAWVQNDASGGALTGDGATAVTPGGFHYP